MSFLLSLVFVVLTTTATQARLSIPSRELGFVYSTGQASALVKIVAFIDLLCHGSMRAYNTLLQVADSFCASDVQLKFHAFSMPFHRHSHTVSKAANLLNAFQCPYNTTVFDWISAAYDNIDSLTTSATFNQSDAEVLDFLASLAHNVSGIDIADFKAGVHDVNIDRLTRLEWKYGITRGVYDVPLFTVNDVFVDADASWTVSQWTDLIDNLLGNNSLEVLETTNTH